MLMKLLAGSLLLAGMFAVLGAAGEKPKAGETSKDCCAAKLACCTPKNACCDADARLGCCEKGMKCCAEKKACCDAPQKCCVKGSDCCEKAKACCGPKSGKSA